MPSNLQQILMECGCGCGVVCCDRVLPLDSLTGLPNLGDNVLPLELTVDIAATPSDGSTTCFNGSAVITYKTAHTGGVNCWEGPMTGTCTDCYGNTFNWNLYITVCCGPDGWLVSVDPQRPTSTPCGPSLADYFTESVCDPVYISGCFVDEIVGCWPGCLVDVTLIPAPSFAICFEVYETP